MVVQSLLKEILPSGFGYVAFVVAGASAVNMYFAMRVMKARKEYGVEYPALYSPDNKQFNCIQRVHQNYGENYPIFISHLLIGGLQNPKSSALAGLMWLTGRLLYAHGYYTGEPDKRKMGGIPIHLADMILFGNVVWFAAVHSGMWNRFSNRWC